MQPKLLLALTVAGTIGAARAALPPIPNAERIKRADAIVGVRVLSLRSQVVEARRDEHGVITHNNFTAQVRVLGVRKGRLKRGALLTVRWWTLGDTPNGWAGPTGQYDAPQQGERRLFFLRGTKSSFDLLEPNGSEILPAPRPSTQAPER